MEVSFTKERYSLRDELDEEGGVEQEVDPGQEDEELEKKVNEVQARTRTTILDMSNRRVSDLPQNSKVFLPDVHLQGFHGQKLR